MSDNHIPTETIKDARLIFLNFSGTPGPKNRNGDRTFCVILEEDQAARMAKQGWNIKTLKAREDVEDSVPRPYISVRARFDVVPPKVVLISGENKRFLGEDSIAILDTADILQTDLILTPSRWDVDGTTGVKAYLKTLYVTVEQDELEAKYGV